MYKRQKKDTVKQAKEETKQLLREYAGYLSDKLDFEESYAWKKQAITDKLAKATTSKDKQVAEAALAALEKKRAEYSKLTGNEQYDQLLQQYKTCLLYTSVAGGILQEGTALGGKDAAGLYHVVKTARLTEDATATTKAYKVAKGHHFKVGDFIMLKVGAKAYKITSINTSETLYDTINVGTTLGEAATAGAALVLAAAESADTTSAFKYVPKAMTGDSYDVEMCIRDR